MSKEENKKPKKDQPAQQGGHDVVRSTFYEYRGEFRKIVWPSRETLFKHTVTVIIVSLIFGAYIALLDGVFGAMFGQFVNLVT